MQIKIILSILILFSLAFLVPSVVFAATSDGSVDSTVEINDTTTNVPALENQDFSGYSVANIDDLDGDGVNDLAVGASHDAEGGADKGTVHILFMNADGSVDSTVEINDSTTNGPELSDADHFGWSVANIGDLNGDGVNDLAVGAPNDNAGGTDSGTVHILFMHKTSESSSKSDHCYDCEPPKLQQAQIQISSNDPVIISDDKPLHVTANVGDEIEIILDVIDDKSVHLLPTSGIYTNFMERPNDMNLFYANNFDDWNNTSTSFYEWNRNHDDVAYDHADTVTWSSPEISYVKSTITTETPFEIINDELVIEHFIISFKMKFTDSMESSQVWVSATDYYGQTLKVPLPFILEILGDEPLDFTVNSNQKVLGYFNEPVLLSILHQWNQSSQDVSELSSILGVNGELPPWTANLATWTIEEKITPAEMIIAIEHVINNF